MKIDPIYKVRRPVYGLGTDPKPCPGCKRPTLFVVEKTDEGRTGVLCKACGWWHPDKKTDTCELSCEGEDGCGDWLGPISVLERTARKKYVCASCAKRRSEAGVPPDPDTQVRHVVLCEGGCGKLAGWLDFNEGAETQGKLKLGYCDACAAKFPKGAPPPKVTERTRLKLEELRSEIKARGQATPEDIDALISILMGEK